MAVRWQGYDSWLQDLDAIEQKYCANNGEDLEGHTIDHYVQLWERNESDDDSLDVDGDDDDEDSIISNNYNNGTEEDQRSYHQYEKNLLQNLRNIQANYKLSSKRRQEASSDILTLDVEDFGHDGRQIKTGRKDLTQINEKKPEVVGVALFDWHIRITSQFSVILDGSKVKDRHEPWHTTVIKERVDQDPRKLKTVTGSIYILQTDINEKAMLQNDFPKTFTEQFRHGFPVNWEAIIKDFGVKFSLMRASMIHEKLVSSNEKQFYGKKASVPIVQDTKTRITQKEEPHANLDCSTIKGENHEERLGTQERLQSANNSRHDDMVSEKREMLPRREMEILGSKNQDERDSFPVQEVDPLRRGTMQGDFKVSSHNAVSSSQIHRRMSNEFLVDVAGASQNFSKHSLNEYRDDVDMETPRKEKRFPEERQSSVKRKRKLNYMPRKRDGSGYTRKRSRVSEGKINTEEEGYQNWDKDVLRQEDRIKRESDGLTAIKSFKIESQNGCNTSGTSNANSQEDMAKRVSNVSGGVAAINRLKTEPQDGCSTSGIGNWQSPSRQSQDTSLVKSEPRNLSFNGGSIKIKRKRRPCLNYRSYQRRYLLNGDKLNISLRLKGENFHTRTMSRGEISNASLSQTDDCSTQPESSSEEHDKERVLSDQKGVKRETKVEDLAVMKNKPISKGRKRSHLTKECLSLAKMEPVCHDFLTTFNSSPVIVTNVEDHHIDECNKPGKMLGHASYQDIWAPLCESRGDGSTPKWDLFDDRNGKEGSVLILKTEELRIKNEELFVEQKEPIIRKEEFGANEKFDGHEKQGGQNKEKSFVIIAKKVSGSSDLEMDEDCQIVSVSNRADGDRGSGERIPRDEERKGSIEEEGKKRLRFNEKVAPVIESNKEQRSKMTREETESENIRNFKEQDNYHGHESAQEVEKCKDFNFVSSRQMIINGPESAVSYKQGAEQVLVTGGGKDLSSRRQIPGNYNLRVMMHRRTEQASQFGIDSEGADDSYMTRDSSPESKVVKYVDSREAKMKRGRPRKDNNRQNAPVGYARSSQLSQESKEYGMDLNSDQNIIQLDGSQAGSKQGSYYCLRNRTPSRDRNYRTADLGQDQQSRGGKSHSATVASGGSDETSSESSELKNDLKSGGKHLNRKEIVSRQKSIQKNYSLRNGKQGKDRGDRRLENRGMGEHLREGNEHSASQVEVSRESCETGNELDSERRDFTEKETVSKQESVQKKYNLRKSIQDSYSEKAINLAKGKEGFANDESMVLVNKDTQQANFKAKRKAQPTKREDTISQLRRSNRRLSSGICEVESAKETEEFTDATDQESDHRMMRSKVRLPKDRLKQTSKLEKMTINYVTEEASDATDQESDRIMMRKKVGLPKDRVKQTSKLETRTRNYETEEFTDATDQESDQRMTRSKVGLPKDRLKQTSKLETRTRNYKNGSTEKNIAKRNKSYERIRPMKDAVYERELCMKTKSGSIGSIPSTSAASTNRSLTRNQKRMEIEEGPQHHSYYPEDPALEGRLFIETDSKRPASLPRKSPVATRRMLRSSQERGGILKKIHKGHGMEEGSKFQSSDAEDQNLNIYHEGARNLRRHQRHIKKNDLVDNRSNCDQESRSSEVRRGRKSAVYQEEFPTNEDLRSKTNSNSWHSPRIYTDDVLSEAADRAVGHQAVQKQSPMLYEGGRTPHRVHFKQPNEKEVCEFKRISSQESRRYPMILNKETSPPSRSDVVESKRTPTHTWTASSRENEEEEARRSKFRAERPPLKRQRGDEATDSTERNYSRKNGMRRNQDIAQSIHNEEAKYTAVLPMSNKAVVGHHTDVTQSRDQRMGIGANHQGYGQSFAVQSAEEDWSDEEIEKLKFALAHFHPNRPYFWQKVASFVGTKSSSSCQSQYEELKHPKKAEKIVKQSKKENDKAKQIKTDSGAIFQETVTAKRGTLRRKKQVREFLEAQDQGYQDDIFDSTPYKNRSRNITLPFDASKFAASCNFEDASEGDGDPDAITSCKDSPYDSSVGSTPGFLSPDILRPIDRDEADAYMYRLKKKRPLQNAARNSAKKQAKHQNVSQRTYANAGDILRKNSDHYDDDESEQDDYYSDDDYNDHNQYQHQGYKR